MLSDDLAISMKSAAEHFRKAAQHSDHAAEFFQHGDKQLALQSFQLASQHKDEAYTLWQSLITHIDQFESDTRPEIE